MIDSSSQAMAKPSLWDQPVADIIEFYIAITDNFLFLTSFTGKLSLLQVNSI